jgi:hypothetical protein
MATFTLGTDFTSAPRQPSYVNGRLLLAADLSSDQSTLRTRGRWIGEAAGSGLVRGMMVTSSATTISVAPGLGLNRAGEPIWLAGDATLPLAVPLAESAPANPAKFHCCGPGSTEETRNVVGAGIYVLTVRPAARTEGSTATAPSPGAATGGGCVATWTLAGVEFRITLLPVGTSVSGIELTDANRRNLVAGWCYGVDPLADLPIDPFGFDQAYGLDLLTDLTDDDLPLATFSWSGQSVTDLDNWSARRRINEPEPDSGGWGVLTAARRTADGRARFHQFQDHTAELLAGPGADQVAAFRTCPLLPPVGLLPVDVGDLKATVERLEAARDAVGEHGRLRETAERDLTLLAAAATAATGPGFNPPIFFGPLARFGGVINWEIAEFLLRESWYRPPVVVTEPDFIPDNPQVAGDVLGTRATAVTYYFVRENVIALSKLGGKQRSRRFRRDRIEATRSNLYVVFVANYLWLGQSQPPFASIGSFVDRPTPQFPDRPGGGVIR